MMLTIEIHIKYTWSFLHVGGFLHLCVLYYLEEHALHDLANISQRKKKQKEKLNQNEQSLLNAKSFI